MLLVICLCFSYLPQQQHGARPELSLSLLQQQAMHCALYLSWDKEGTCSPRGAAARSPNRTQAQPPLPVGSLNTAPASTLVLVKVLIITAMLGTLFFGSCFKAA